MTKLFVVIIAGPTGVGKTTLAKMLSKHYHCSYLSEDKIAEETFPGEYKKIEVYPDKQKTVTDILFKRTNDIFCRRECVVVDMINLESEFVQKAQRIFNKHLKIRVLYPPIEAIIDRDRKRDGWTSGEDAIRSFYQKYEGLKSTIGERNYINNSNQAPEKTLNKIVVAIDTRD